MNLSSKELKALKKIRKQEAQFQKLKYIFAALSIVLAISLFYLESRITKVTETLVERPESMAIFIATYYPTLLAYCVIAGTVIGYTLKNWKGDSDRILLIGIAEKLALGSSEDNA